MDALVGFIMKVAECFVDPIKRRTKLVTDYQNIKINLRNQNEELSRVLSRVQNQAKQAKNNAERLTEEVNKWLTEVQTTKEEVNSWLTNIGDTKPTCGPCLDCCKLFKVSKEAIRKTKIVSALIEQGNNNFSQVSFPGSPKGIQLISCNEFTAFDSTTISFNEVLAALGRNNTKMVSVFGMGGIGKTTLVTEVGKVAKERKMFDQVVFAVVSQTPDIRKIQGQLGDMLGLTFSRETEMGRAGQLSDRLMNENRILVILDDVWNKIELADIGIPFGNNNSCCCKILLTTRRENVCTSMECEEIIRLNLLEENEAWELFKKNVGEVLVNDPSLEMKEVAEQVIKECQRLPLALVVVGCALSGKYLEDWKIAAERLQKSRLVDLETVDRDRNVYKCFRLSYDYLKAEATKKCFLLCSLFPEDYEIDVEELAKYAMGFGLFEDVDSFNSVKSRVHKTIRDLKDSSLLLKTDSMAYHVKMHDMVRDAALWITSEDEEPFIVPTPLENNNWVRKSGRLQGAMAISLLACPMNDRFPIRGKCPRLKILLCAQRVPLQLPDNCFQGLQTLRVLDLTAAKIHLEMELPPSLQYLQNLQTLLLRRWKLKGNISLIGSLTTLEILSFSTSLFVELPIQLGELLELRVLDLSGCQDLSVGSYTEVQKRLPSLEILFTPNQPPTLAFEDEDVDADEDE